MLNTPPDFKVDQVLNDCEVESCGTFAYEQPELTVSDSPEGSQLAILEVAKLAVEVKKVEATATLELERLRQHGVTARVRISEENKTQRSACFSAMVKRAVEEHHQTEREKMALTAQTQQASIAAEVKKAELEAQRPRPISTYWLLLLLYFDRSRRRVVKGFPMARVAVFLLLLRALWTFSGSNSGPLGSSWNLLWRGALRALQRRNLLGDVLSQPRLTSTMGLAPLVPLEDSPSAASRTDHERTASWSSLPLDKELEDQGLMEYNKVLRNTGYDMDVLRELKEEEEVEEMFRAIQCRPEHRELFLKLLKRA